MLGRTSIFRHHSQKNSLSRLSVMKGFKIVLPHQLVSRAVNVLSDDHKTVRFDVNWPNNTFEVVAHPIRQIPYGKFSVEEAMNMVNEEKPDLVLIGAGMEQYLELLKEVSIGDMKRTKRVPDVEFACARVSGLWSPVIMRCVAEEIPIFPVGMNRANMANLIGSKLWRKPIECVKLFSALLSKNNIQEIAQKAPAGYAATMVLPAQYSMQQISHTLHLATKRRIDIKAPFKDIPGLSASTLTAGGRMALPEDRKGKVLVLLPNLSFPYMATALPVFLNSEAKFAPPNYPLMLILNFQRRRWLNIGITMWAIIPALALTYALSPVFSATWKFIVDPVGISIGGDEFIRQHDQQTRALMRGENVEDAVNATVDLSNEVLEENNSLWNRIVRRAKMSWAAANGQLSGVDSSRD
eukprot:GDKJ01032568.1.p1 GENE.GDKJ01032568.1~~GDKJ01032568.1.p1  ORF type:complete len:410 (-),score=79.79 GDKJ01032568.1:48-1277(-)